MIGIIVIIITITIIIVIVIVIIIVIIITTDRETMWKVNVIRQKRSTPQNKSKRQEELGRSLSSERYIATILFFGYFCVFKPLFREGSYHICDCCESVDWMECRARINCKHLPAWDLSKWEPARPQGK